jgi:hypothetical protein
MIRAAEIEAAIVRNFGVPRELFYSPCRHWSVSHPRQLAMFLTRDMIGMTLPQIARRHNRDHTTVIHGIKAAANRLANDPVLARKVDAIKRVLRDNARKPANSSETWARILGQIEDPISRKIVIMSKYERGELTRDETSNLIRALDLEAA